MSQKRTAVAFTRQILEAYRNAAIQNADALANEARLLLDHGHFSRAYFLGVAAIEEIRKATIAHTSQGRNLDAPNVQKPVAEEFRDHHTKITNALIAPLLVMSPEDIRQRDRNSI
ncbi:AbiV family abortive infection protein [Pyruvatibacter sp.]|uniref:AbiV family abortive infection protein n=1 Tax=Pyruvatibacter sp. TaxID=1981328 RepID=UPI0032EB4590